jgi:hypothetical protein
VTDPASLPREVLRFIEEHIDSVSELEMLLMMSDAPRAWALSEIAARTYVPVDKAQAMLDVLVRRRLVKPADISQYYMFSPTDETERALVREVSRAYRSHLALIATLIHNKASGSVREFARAFDLKKDH